MKYIIELISKFNDTGIKSGISGTKELKKNTDSANKSLSGLAATGLKVAAALVAFKAVSSVFFKIAIAGDEQRKAIISLDQAMKAAGRTYDATAKSLVAYSGELQKNTRFADEQILAGSAQLVRFGAWGDRLKTLTALTLDFATAQRMDLGAAFDLMAKTVGSSTNALSRYGIEVEGAVGSNARMDALITALSSKFEGLASQSANTLQGRIEQLKNSFGDLMEEVEGLISASGLPGFISWMSQTISIVTEFLALSDNRTAAEIAYANALDRRAALQKIVSDLDAKMNEGQKLNTYETNRYLVALRDLQTVKKELAAIEKTQLAEDNRRRAAASAASPQAAVAAAAAPQFRAPSQALFQTAPDVSRYGSDISLSMGDAVNKMTTDLMAYSETYGKVMEQVVGLSQSASNNAASAFRSFLDSSSDRFLSFGDLVGGVFQGILDAFLDMVAQMAAKMAIFAIFNTVSGGAFSAFTGGLKGFLGFADGGRPPVGRPSIVGENGPELFVPDSAGTVVPNGAMGSMSITVSPTINISGAVDTSTIRQITEAIKRGTSDAVEMSKAAYKVGQSRSAESGL